VRRGGARLGRPPERFDRLQARRRQAPWIYRTGCVATIHVLFDIDRWEG